MNLRLKFDYFLFIHPYNKNVRILKMEKLELKEESGKVFSYIRNTWLIATPEERVRQKCVCTLVNHYGYSLAQMAEEKQSNKTAFIVIECKAENIVIKEEDYFQGLNYATWAGATFFITTNEKL